MKVFKFGGASVKDAASVKNVAEIIHHHGSPTELLVVVSAMGKTTNLLEKIVEAFLEKKDHTELVNQFSSYHLEIVNKLFLSPQSIEAQIKTYVEELNHLLYRWSESDNDMLYDQVVSIGELVSSLIVYTYLHDEKKIPCTWLDARSCIKTDKTWREGKIDWTKSTQQIKQHVLPTLKKQFIVTQGFIGQTYSGETTTLGREGSDYTAAIFAHILDADSVTIWKDVPGVLNADPKLVEKTILFDQLSYAEAAEMTYYGATVIHPKTIRPLQDKHIPLHVRSFIKPDQPGTIISSLESKQIIPTIIFKPNQLLISFDVKDLYFIHEDKLGKILYQLASHAIRVNMMQHSALSFSVCVDQSNRIKKCLRILEDDFIIKFNDNLTLLTIRNYNQELINQLIPDPKHILLEQRTRHTIQVLINKNI